MTIFTCAFCNCFLADVDSDISWCPSCENMVPTEYIFEDYKETDRDTYLVYDESPEDAELLHD